MLPVQRMAERIKGVTDVFGHVVKGIHLASISWAPAPVQLWGASSEHSWPRPYPGVAVPMVGINLKCQGSVQRETKGMSKEEYELPCGGGRHAVLEGDSSRVVSEFGSVA